MDGAVELFMQHRRAVRAGGVNVFMLGGLCGCLSVCLCASGSEVFNDWRL